jgi:hypothetical protein
MRFQVINGFDRMTVEKLLGKTDFVLNEITNNVDYFPDPNPPLADVRAAATELNSANLAARNMDKVAISYRNEKKDELVALLRKLGIYVNLRADSNRTIALSSGFNIRKDSQPSPSITGVEVPVITAGLNEGELDAKVKTVAGARMYQYFISTDDSLPVSGWMSYSSTRRKFSFTGLDSATRYYVRVAAIGINNQMVYSDSASFVTQ